jgi:hypothetical protein
MTVTAPMTPSAEIRDTMLELYRRMLAGEADEANDLISRDPALVFIGSAGEWVDDQETLRSGTQEPGEGLVAGEHPVAYADGDVGFFADHGGAASRAARLARDQRPHVGRGARRPMRDAATPLEARPPGARGRLTIDCHLGDARQRGYDRAAASSGDGSRITGR